MLHRLLHVLKVVLAVGFWLTTGAGCQLLPYQQVEPDWKIAVRTELAEALSTVHWQPRVDWSPTNEWENRQDNRPTATWLRWRYASLAWRDVLSNWQDRWALLQAESPEALNEKTMLWEVASSNDLPGWNAAILLGQLYPEEAKQLAPILEKLVTEPPTYPLPPPELPQETPEPTSPVARIFRKAEPKPKPAYRRIPLAMQLAAAEAWCLVLASQPGDPIDNLAPAGKAVLSPHLPAELQGELFRAIARWVPPTQVPGLDLALPANRGPRPNPQELRRAAMDACVMYALWHREAVSQSLANSREESPWPSTLENWQWEPDAYFESNSTIRRRFAYWMVLTRHPNAARILETHLTDQDFLVRDDALIHLGWLKTPEALDTLLEHANRPEPRIRAMAVKGLAHWGVRYVAKYLGDSSHEVRRSVAEELGRYPTQEAAIQMRSLQADASRDVELAALDATRNWPDELAIPLLLHGMEHASVVTRRECFRELRRRTHLQDTFPITAGPDVRKAAVETLAKTWNLPAHLGLKPQQHQSDEKIHRLRVNELRMYLADVMNLEFAENSARVQFALKALQQSSRDDAPAIETFLLEQPTDARAAIILEQVLPALDPIYKALQNIRSEDVQQRRSSANELRQIAERQSLSPLAVRRLQHSLQRETDSLVWRSAMAAILPDNNPETTQLVAWAANHPDSGIRQLACEFALRHKRPAFAEWLLPLLHDDNSNVQLQAIEAAGQCGNRVVIDGIATGKSTMPLPGLRDLLADSDSRISVAAAIAMSRLGDPQGHDELIRLAHHPDPKLSLQVIEAMGSSRQTRFLETLIGLGWTARNEATKSTVLEALKRLVPVEQHPQGLNGPLVTEEQIKLWAEWWDQHRG